MQNAFNEIFEYVKELYNRFPWAPATPGGCRGKGYSVIIEYPAH